MTTTALAPAPELETSQIDLIRRTVAAGATDDELALFLFDCQRRGVHPLDRLLHFTKRNNKYTPITSIDFLRMRAHGTGHCVGISDAEFSGDPKKPGFQARVVVKRLVSGIVAEFAATARWDEYKPQANDFMWLRMGHTMLGKCAESLALRKAFPQELAGLYSADEMAQAGVPPTPPPTGDPVNVQTGEILEARVDVTPSEPARTAPDPRHIIEGLCGATAIRTTGDIAYWEVALTTDFGEVLPLSTRDSDLADRAVLCEGKRVQAEYKRTAKGGWMLLDIQRVE